MIDGIAAVKAVCVFKADPEGVLKACLILDRSVPFYCSQSALSVLLSVLNFYLIIKYILVTQDTDVINLY